MCAFSTTRVWPFTRPRWRRRAAAVAGELVKTSSRLGLPAVRIESRQAHQALKSLATHKTDRNDARGPAHLVRTGSFKPVYVKSLSATPSAADHCGPRRWSVGW